MMKAQPNSNQQIKYETEQQHQPGPTISKDEQLAPFSDTLCCELGDLVQLESFFADGVTARDIFDWYLCATRHKNLEEVHPLITENTEFLEEVHQWLQNGISHHGFSKEKFEEQMLFVFKHRTGALG